MPASAMLADSTMDSAIDQAGLGEYATDIKGAVWGSAAEKAVGAAFGQVRCEHDTPRFATQIECRCCGTGGRLTN